MIKSSLNELMPVYLKLFNTVLDLGTMPQMWCDGLITPIFNSVTGRVNCFEVTAGSCPLLHSERSGKFAYRKLFLIKNRNFHSAVENETM